MTGTMEQHPIMSRPIRNRALMTVALVAVIAGAASGQARIRDIADVEGVRSNPIQGIGLVVGLNGTGDGATLTRQAAGSLLKRSGLNLNIGSIPPENMALVLVSAALPPFSRPGSRINVTVSSMGDATSLRGGQLVRAQLTGFDNRTVYAIANGPVMTGAVTAQGNTGSKETINHPTVGRIPSGASVEVEVPQKLVSQDGKIRLLLRRANFSNAKDMVSKINAVFPGAARAIDGLKVEVDIPAKRQHDPVAFVADIGEITVDIRPKAVVVINERTGTIIAGGDVVILEGTITHSNLSISIKEKFDVSQPNGNGINNAETAVTPNTDIQIREDGTPLVPIPQSVGAGEVAKALNTLGVSPLDLISIFQDLERTGLLQAELRIE